MGNVFHGKPPLADLHINGNRVRMPAIVLGLVQRRCEHIIYLAGFVNLVIFVAQ